MWLSEEQFREIYVTDSATAISSRQIDQCLNAGIRTATSFIGTAIALEVKDSEEPFTEKVNDLREAQGKLAYRELLLLMSSRFRDGGITTTEKDVNDSVTNQYESFDKTEKRRAALYSEAIEILELYRISTAPVIDDSPMFFPSTTVSKKIVW